LDAEKLSDQKEKPVGRTGKKKGATKGTGSLRKKNQLKLGKCLKEKSGGGGGKRDHLPLERGFEMRRRGA